MSDSSSSTPLNTLAAYLAGEFENQAQAAAEPAWYVHLRLWQRPIPALSNASTYTFFLEQASVGALKPPYRQRILQLSQRENRLYGEYFALSAAAKFVGAGADPSLLMGCSKADLVSLPNSEAPIQYQPLPLGGYQFQAALPEGQLCSFGYGGERRYVYLGFDIAPKKTAPKQKSPEDSASGDTIELMTYDKGVDPETGQGLWGALMGPFRMIKQKAYPLPERSESGYAQPTAR